MRRSSFCQFLSAAVLCAGVLVVGVAVAQEAATEAPKETAEPRMGTVTATVLNVRARPSRQYETVLQLRRGDEVRIVDETDDWYEVVLSTQAKAWIASRYVGADNAVSGNRVRVHSGPGLVFTAFAYVNKGDKLELVGEVVNGWQQIVAPAFSTGWVSKGFVEVPEPPAPEVVVTESGATEGSGSSVAETGEETSALTVVVVGANDAVVENGAATGEVVKPAAGTTTESPAEETGTVTVSSADTETVTVSSADTEIATVAVTEDGGTSAEGPEAAEGSTGATAAEEEIVVVPASLPEFQPRPIIKEGIVLSLRPSETQAASHVLTMRVGFTCYTLCFLWSEDLDLREWEQREVRVQGDELWYQGWKRPVIRVSSIQLKPTY